MKVPNILFEISVNGKALIQCSDSPSTSPERLTEIFDESQIIRPLELPVRGPEDTLTFRHRTLAEPIIRGGMVVGVDPTKGRWRDGLPNERFLSRLVSKWGAE